MNYNIVGDFLDTYETLIPPDEMISTLLTDDWWIATESQFDDLIWMYFYEREIYDFPRFNPSTPETAYNNIRRTIAIYLNQNRRRYERMFNAFMSDFNPLWNVDGVTGTIQEQTHTGTDTYKKTGDDTLNNTGTDTNVKTGNQTDAGSGFDKLIHHYDSWTMKTGDETEKYSGEETNTKEVTTFDSDTLKTTEKNTTGYGEELQGTQKIINKNYDDVKDMHDGEDYDKNELGSTQTLTFNNVTDALTHGKQAKTTYNSTDTNTKNLSDKFVEMVIRQGNIGVTRSDELITRALELFNNTLYDFYKIVVTDCVNQISYRLY